MEKNPQPLEVDMQLKIPVLTCVWLYQQSGRGSYPPVAEHTMIEITLKWVYFQLWKEQKGKNDDLCQRPKI